MTRSGRVQPAAVPGPVIGRPQPVAACDERQLSADLINIVCKLLLVAAPGEGRVDGRLDPGLLTCFFSKRNDRHRLKASRR